MLNQATLDKMYSMRLPAMARELERQMCSSEIRELEFEERVGLLVDTEWSYREQTRLSSRLRLAKLRYPASIEDVDFKVHRGLDRQVFLSLADCQWIRDHGNVIITGSTGAGKSYLACALAEKACRTGKSAYYVRAPRLLQDLAVARGDGSYGRLLARLAKADLLAIDDWLLSPLKDSERRDLLEVIEERYQRAATLIASQLPVKDWHEAIGEPTLADAICDRLIHGAHRIALTGPSLRDKKQRSKASPTESA
jgi:DNA replication protein DnaC